MAETLEVVFRSGWTFFGTCFLIVSIGWALSFPCFWWYKTKQLKMNRSIWELHNN